jgi:Flp pilus assembly protein TadD
MAPDLLSRGNELVKLERLQEALEFYNKSIELNQNLANSYNGRGVALAKLGQISDARDSFEAAIALNSEYARALYNSGMAHSSLGLYQEATYRYGRAIALDPQFADAYNNRGISLVELGRIDEALTSYNEAIRLKPDYAEAHNNRGTALTRLNRTQQSLDSLEKAVALRPDYADAHMNRALQLLRVGRLLDGWEAYEWRTRQAEHITRTYPAPLLSTAKGLTGKKVFLHWEQGLGDTIQFCRYAKLIQALGAHVTLSVQSPLVRLLRQLEPGVEIIGADRQPVSFDLHSPLLGLPKVFRTTLETIPRQQSYLQADPSLAASWRERLGPQRRPRIGLVWSGSPGFKNDHNRSLRFNLLAPLLELDVDWISLQKELRPEDTVALTRLGKPAFYGDQLTDFADTAALTDQLDLVISVDTSVAHLAAAMGKPTWILLPFSPDWRWLLDRPDSPWYPSARLFRQPAIGDWGSVVEAVKAALSTEMGAAAPCDLGRQCRCIPDRAHP